MTWNLRRLAMAGELPPIDGSQALLGWLSGLATATIGAVGLWLAQRVLGKAAFQTAINDGFQKLTSELQEERERLHREIDEERRVFADERRVFSAERISWSEERGQLKGRIRQLEQQVQGLEKRLGIEPSAALEAEPGSDII